MRDVPRCSTRTRLYSRESTETTKTNCGEADNSAATSSKPKRRGSRLDRRRRGMLREPPDANPELDAPRIALLFGSADLVELLQANALGKMNRIANGETLSMPGIEGRGRAPRSSQIRFERLAAKHDQVMAIGDLLIRAIAIQTDIRRRALRQPNNKVLVKQGKHYERLVSQLLWEHKSSLADYLSLIRLLTKP